MSKSIEEIDVYKELSPEDFLLLFEQVPLLDTEVQELNEFYFPFYKKMLECNVIPETAWVATRNVFIVKNSEISKRYIK